LCAGVKAARNEFRKKEITNAKSANHIWGRDLLTPCKRNKEGREPYFQKRREVNLGKERKKKMSGGPGKMRGNVTTQLRLFSREEKKKDGEGQALN